MNGERVVFWWGGEWGDWLLLLCPLTCLHESSEQAGGSGWIQGDVKKVFWGGEDEGGGGDWSVFTLLRLLV